MRNYIILNGTNSNTITGLLIQELAPISKPLMRTEVEEIDGRDGDIITPLGFSAYDKEITIGLYGSFDINAIIAFFNSEGTVVFSNEPDKYYNYTIYQQIDFERLVRFKTAKVTLHCQPFKYGTTGETETFGDGSTVSGTGSNIVLENSTLAPFNKLDLKGNTVQDGTPTPSTPVPVQTVTGENVVEICGKNLFNKNNSGILDDVRVSTSNGKTYGSVGSHVSYFIKVKPSTKYTLTTGRTAYYSWYSAPSEDSYISGSGWQDRYYFESPANAQYIRFDFADGNIVQFVEGTSVGAYEPYQGQSYPITLGVTGKNLLNLTRDDRTGGSFDTSTNTYTSNTRTGTSAWCQRIDVTNGTTYTFSCKSISNAEYKYRFSDDYYDSSADIIAITSGTITNGNLTVTNSINAKYLYVSFRTVTAGTDSTLQEPMLEVGSSASSYAPYVVYELSEQDYFWQDGSTWKMRKNTVKIVLNGLESWTSSGTSSVYRYYTSDYSSTIQGIPENASSISDRFVFDGVVSGTLTVGHFFLNKSGGTTVANGNISIIPDQSNTTVALLKTWLASNNVQIYVPAVSPADIAVTNEALIAQLDDIATQAHAYKNRTHIIALAATGNAPHIIDAEVVTASADGTITNAGNIYSKPRLTIYGSGNIGVYLDGVQMFQIALGALGHITIDTNLMEAYKDTTDNLQNRAVTGDYNNFKLPVGSSKITFSGIVTSCTIENYSRWL